jgi:hypothetical protein
MPAERGMEIRAERGKQKMEKEKRAKRRMRKERSKKTAPDMLSRRWQGLRRYPS